MLKDNKNLDFLKLKTTKCMVHVCWVKEKKRLSCDLYTGL